MPSIFPTVPTEPLPVNELNQKPVAFGRSVRFDYDRGEFIMTPTGKIAGSTDTEAWMEWCQKALNTQRYRYLVYSRNYGQEYDELIGRHLTREGNESEMIRMTTECLMVDPRTASVQAFAFKWEEDRVYFTCEVVSVRGETGQINGEVKM
ncbi:DUF2634 domain-containing protein [Desulforamulus ruminis]|uniref:DUF2634 domain-containing protein n=1 Tax=Desulforamulus ruminis (strain ATCC 23193 / DSM 2154 / NCIMB 8452 / DL) TaxID=696281 RepID=F6DLQ5_DESRL|nr:DUF2634 domain-containing protein [Desulforamulus ruminis]AEG61697.1 hypothetical protein Desru_3494 [Desulforamulus ruminis DSM 2154]